MEIVALPPGIKKIKVRRTREETPKGPANAFSSILLATAVSMVERILPSVVSKVVFCKYPPL